MSTIQFFVNQDVCKYTDRLSNWTYQVTASRDNLNAFRLAAHLPPEGKFAAAVRPATAANRRSALHKVERSLEKRLTEMTVEEVRQHPDILRRSTQGRYPRIFQRIVSILMSDQ